MSTIEYTETFLPELAYLVAERGSVAQLNHAAGFTSYFERDDVLRCGQDVAATRDGAGPLQAVADVIASSATTFTVKSGVLPELATMYFPAADGVAEVSLVQAQTFVALHPAGTVTALLLRHLQSETALVVRRGGDGSRRELAVGGTRYALRDGDDPWRAGSGTLNITTWV